MNRHPDQDRIDGKLTAIAELSRAELIVRWKAAHRKTPPKGISRRLLEYSAAYQAQVKVFGGLKSSTRRKLIGRLSSSSGNEIRSGLPRKSESLSPGSRLVREWHGNTYTVDVGENCFRFDGRAYKSLSEIARHITGARWSGPRFFGL